MTTVVFYLLVALTAGKVYREVVRPPREWMGELVTIVVSVLVAAIGATALLVAGI